jgi:beta-fructofuranosidase
MPQPNYRPRYPGNPIISQPPENVPVTGFRDPYVWREKDEWLMLVGSGIRGQGGTALLYRSIDLIHWEFCNPLYVGELEHSGFVWNCPNFFALDGRHVLIVSGQRIWKPFYFTGQFSHYRFEPETRGLVDYGGNLYAPQVFIDQHGRCILWGWIWEAQQDYTIKAQGWAGVMALPRLLYLRPDHTLASRPAAEVEQLRREEISLAGGIFTGEREMPEWNADALEIQIEIDPLGAARAGLSVFRAPDGSEQTRIGYDRSRGTVFIDRTCANLSPVMAFDWPNPDYHEVEVPLNGQPLNLRIFLDRSVIEVFAGDGYCLSSRVYPKGENSTGVALFAEQGSACVTSLRAWRLSL